MANTDHSSTIADRIREGVGDALSVEWWTGVTVDPDDHSQLLVELGDQPDGPFDVYVISVAQRSKAEDRA